MRSILRCHSKEKKFLCPQQFFCLQRRRHRTSRQQKCLACANPTCVSKVTYFLNANVFYIITLKIKKSLPGRHKVYEAAAQSSKQNGATRQIPDHVRYYLLYIVLDLAYDLFLQSSNFTQAGTIQGCKEAAKGKQGDRQRFRRNNPTITVANCSVIKGVGAAAKNSVY